MTFSYDNWKKNQKKNTAGGVKSFDQFKSSREQELPATRTSIKTYEQFQSEREAARMDAQAPKSEKARQADADRFARGNKTVEPKSEKAKKADADRFAAGAQARSAAPPKSDTAKKADADRFAGGAQARSKEITNPAPPKKEPGVLAKFLDDFIQVGKDTGAVDMMKAYDPRNIAKTDEVQAFTNKDNVNDTLIEKRNASLRLGIGDTVKSLGEGITYLDKKIMVGNNALGDSLISKGGKRLAEQGAKMNEGFEGATYGKDFSAKSLIDPDWYATSVTRTLPNAASSIAPGLVTAKILGNVNKIAKLPKMYKTIIQSIGGAGATTAYDSAILSGGVYEEAKKRGMSEEQAIAAADKAFIQNSAVTGGMTALEFGLGLTPLTKGLSKVGKAAQIGARTAGGAAAEAFQEAAQTGIETKALGDEFRWTDPSTIEAAIIGGIIGGTMTGGLASYGLAKDSAGKIVSAPTTEQSTSNSESNPVQEIMESTITALPPKRREQFDEAVFALREQGVEVDEAIGMAFEEMVNTYPDVEQMLVGKSSEYKVDKQMKREMSESSQVANSDTAAKAAQGAPVAPTIATQVDAQAAPQADIQPEAQPTVQPEAQSAPAANATAADFQGQLDAMNAMNENVFNEDGTVNTKELNKAQKKAAETQQSKNIKNKPLEAASDINATNTPGTKTASSNEVKSTSNKDLKLNPGDKVNLQGTNAKTLYEVQNVKGNQATVITPNGKTINIPKSRITQVAEVAGSLPTNFRADVNSVLNEMVKGGGMSIKEAVSAMKSDTQYNTNPEWSKTIEEEATNNFGYKSKEEAAKAPEQPKKEVAKEVKAEPSKETDNTTDFKVGETVYADGNQQVTITSIKGNRVDVKTNGGRIVTDVSNLTREPKVKKDLPTFKDGDVVRDKREGFSKVGRKVVGIDGDFALLESEDGSKTERYPMHLLEMAEDITSQKAPEKESEPKEKKKQMPSTGKTFTENGTEIKFKYKVVDASELIASNNVDMQVNEDYPQELQPRDRSRAASKAQVQDMARKLNPELLGASPKASDGAPIVGDDMVVESGNGRTIAMQKMYKEGYDSKEAYTEFVEDFADTHGLTVPSDIENPILVRVRTNEVDRKQFVEEANVSGVTPMSTTEQAATDAGKLRDALMSKFTVNEQGNLDTADNRNFLLSFMDEVIPSSERNRYVDSKDKYSQEFFNRVTNAIFEKAYGSSQATSILTENTDNNIRNVTNAMLRSAPKFAKMRSDISKGSLFDADITTDVVAAMVKLTDLRKDGTDVKTFLNQTSMFDEMTNEGKEMINIFDDKSYKRSPKRLSELFNQYVEVLEAAGLPNQIGLFEDTPPTKADILTLALKRVETNENSNVQGNLFEAESENVTQARTQPKKKGNKNQETFLNRRQPSEDKEFNPNDSPEGNDREVTRGDIVEFISDKFKISIHLGKARGHRGIYKNKFAITRMKDYGDFEVLAHELGHHIDLKLGLSTNPTIRKELIDFAEKNLQLSESMTDSTKAKEGVAEYFRQIFYNENGANVGVEELSDTLNNAIAKGLKDKGWVEHTNDLQEMMMSWLKRDAAQELRGVFSPIGEKRKTRRTAKRYMNDMYTNIFEEGHPIFMAMEAARKETGKVIEGKDDAYAMFRLTRGSTARAATYASGYTFDKDGVVTGESLEAILKDVDDIEVFGHYLGARRGMYLKENRGKKKLPFSDALINEYLEKETPQYKELAQRIYDYQDRLLSVLVDGGLIPADLPAQMKENDPYYVPFYRVMNDTGVRDGASGGGKGKSIANQQQGIKKMSEESSSRTIINPIENIIKNTHLFFALADRNGVGKALSNLADVDSEFSSEVSRDIIEEVPNSFAVTEVALNQLKKTLLDSGLDADVMEELDMTQKAKVFNPVFKPNSAQDEILVWKEGKPKLYRVHDKMLYNALVVGDNSLVNNITENIIFETAAASNKALRWGITASPYFTVRTFARSLFQLMVKTDARGLNYLTQGGRVLKSIKNVLAKDPAMYDWWASGGAQSTFIAVENDYIDKKLNSLAMNRKALNLIKFKYKPQTKKERNQIIGHMVKNIALSPFKGLQVFNDILDQSLKMAEYEVVKKQTGSRTEAAIASRDADADYSRMGKKGIRQYNQINLFFNISLQGPDNVMRTFAKHPVRTSLRGMMLTVPTILLYMMNRDDEEYKELNSWEKDLNWMIPKGDGTFYKIPIPFELGLVFKTLPEKLWGELMDYVKGEDEQTFKDAWKNASKTLLPSVLPTAAEMYYKYKTGKDSMNDRDFVPMGLQGLPKAEQYTETTSEVMKWLGSKLNRSPIILEETFKAQFGQMGQGGLWGADALLDAAGVIDKPDNKGITPSYTERYLKSSVNDGGTASISDFYDKKRELEEAYKATGKKYDVPEELEAFKKAGADMTLLRKLRNEIMFDRIGTADGQKFTKEEKKAEIAIINKGMRDVARTILGKEALDQENLELSWLLADEYDAYLKAVDKGIRQEVKERKENEQ